MHEVLRRQAISAKSL